MKLARFISTGIILFSAACQSVVFSSDRSEYWHQRVSLFEKLPISSSDIVFLGNSITDGGEFTEMLGDLSVKNRGINSDDILGVTERIGSIVDGKPQKIFLLIGINDISHNLSVNEMARLYENLVKIIRERTPDTELYIQSVMPINNDFKRYRNLLGKEKVVKELNLSLGEIAKRYNATYIDLWDTLVLPGSDKLNPDFTNDGLHLLGEGYLRWLEVIKNYI